MSFADDRKAIIAVHAAAARGEAVSADDLHAERFDADWLNHELQRTRNIAIEDAARAVEHFHMPPSGRYGDGPVTMMEVKAEIAKALRAMKR